MTFILPDLPYATDALEPTIGQQTLEIHHGKHHQSYLTKVNDGLKEAGRKVESLEEIFLNKDDALLNAAAQSWNHEFYWNSMSPNGGGKPEGTLLEAICKSFGNYEDFCKAFSAKAAGQFGSGWAWLVLHNGSVEVIATGNAENPQMQDKTPLMTIDVWEHAYYLDFQNKRPDYISAFLDKLVNWEFAQANYDKAVS